MTFQHPKGDRALLAAINATPDSAITDAMRSDAAATAAKVDAEQKRYGVWYNGSKPFEGKPGWCTDANDVVITFDSSSAADKAMHEWGFIRGTHEVRPYPTPTTSQAAEVGQGRWKCVYAGKWGGGKNYLVTDDDIGYGPMYQEDARSLAARLNAADELAELLDESLVALQFVQRGQSVTLGHMPDDLVPRLKAAIAKFGGTQ